MTRGTSQDVNIRGSGVAARLLMVLDNWLRELRGHLHQDLLILHRQIIDNQTDRHDLLSIVTNNRRAKLLARYARKTKNAFGSLVSLRAKHKSFFVHFLVIKAGLAIFSLG